MGATGTVEELDVDVDRFAVAADADGDSLRHPVEVERGVPVRSRGPDGHFTGTGRHVALGVDARRGDLGDLLHACRQDPVGNEEHVRVERGTLVSSDDLGDHTGGRDGSAPGDLATGADHVVELEVGVG